jgi:hypothetical protein
MVFVAGIEGLIRRIAGGSTEPLANAPGWYGQPAGSPVQL